jgi:hypothetical protein
LRIGELHDDNDHTRGFNIVLYAPDTNGDGRPDDISLQTVPKGHPLEELASVEKLSEIEEMMISESE